MKTASEQYAKATILAPIQLLVALACAIPQLLTLACAIPPDINVRQDGLNPPSLDRSMISPSPDQVVELTSSSIEFSVASAVTNVQAGDQLYFQWFVGYPESATPRPPAFESFDTIQFNPCGFSDVLAPVGSTHSMELFITEDPMDFDPVTGRVVPDSYIYVSWPIRLKVSCP